MYIRFLDSKTLIKCNVIPQDNIVTLKFEENIIVDTSGFQLFLDEKAEYDIGGNNYLKFTTIYRNDSETEKHNSYQLSNDKSIYEEKEIIEIPNPTPTEEELKEQEKQNQIMELNSQISGLKSQLSESDYVFTKNYELMLVGKATDEYNFEVLHTERQDIRDNINELETNLKALMEETA